MKRRKSRRKSRRGHSRVRYNRRHGRRHRRNRGGGKYSSFVKKHKGLYKKYGFKTASKKIAAMWRRTH